MDKLPADLEHELHAIMNDLQQSACAARRMLQLCFHVNGVVATLCVISGVQHFLNHDPTWMIFACGVLAWLNAGAAVTTMQGQAEEDTGNDRRRRHRTGTAINRGRRGGDAG